MKKVIASAIGLAMVSSASAAFAIEHQFGGYWRTRAYVADEMFQDGEDYSIQDNRTRLFYTAKFNENFKFVNKFEFNSSWGDDEGGDFGADGDTFVVKNSYADFTFNNVNTKLGIMGAVLARGFLIDDDFSGIMVSPKIGDNSFTLGYMSISNSDLDDSKYEDSDGWAFLLSAALQPTDSLKITPYFYYASIDDSSVTGYKAVAGPDGVKSVPVELGHLDDVSTYYLGADFDMKTDSADLWATLIYNGGEINDHDINAFLVAAGAQSGIAHGQAFYASGDDDLADDDHEGFFNAPGQSYYWSEIMGYGIFDNAWSAGSCGDKITNVAAFNVGVTLQPAEKFTFTGDVWYAFTAEKNVETNDERDLGVEFDGKLTYQIFDNLSADFVLAYLIAGDATGDEDIFEGGVRVSLSF